MKLLSISAAILAGALTSACVKVQPQITRRYETQTPVAVASGIEARLDVFAMDVSQESARTTLLNLAERGQASLIRQLGAKSKDSSELLTALGKSIKAPRNPEREIDRTVVQRRVVFSVENQSPGPADRISLARITLDTLSSGAEFQEWTQFATKYETADLGTLKFNRSREFDLTLTFDPTAHVKELTKAEAASKSIDAIEENIKLSQRYVPVTGSLSPQRAELIQQGVPGIDLTGNLAVDLTVRVRPNVANTTDTFSIGSLFDDAGAPKPPGQVTIARQTARYVPRPATDITARAILNATIRHVVSGDDTLMEGDDEVEFRYGPTAPITLTLVPKEALQFSVWLLRDRAGSALNINMGGSAPEALQLSGFDDAVALRDYLRQPATVAQIGGRALSLNGVPLSSTAAASLQVSIEKLNW